MSDVSRVINEVADEMEAILARNPCTCPNPTAIAQLRFQADRLHGRASEAAAMAREIVVLATDYYSATKHARHLGGAAGLRAKLSDRVMRLRAAAEARRDGHQ